MAVSLLDVFSQFFDNDGNPLAGGLVYTYNALTLAPLATYTDATGATPHENPIQLDSDGRPPAPIFWTRGTAYKAELKTAEGVELDDVISFTIPDDNGPSEGYDPAYFFLGGPPSASQELFRFKFVRAVDFPANFAGSGGSVGVNPTASFVETVKKNGATVGTITTNTSGVSAFASTAGAAVSFDVGDVLTVVGPSSADSTVANIARTFAGTLG